MLSPQLLNLIHHIEVEQPNVGLMCVLSKVIAIAFTNKSYGYQQKNKPIWEQQIFEVAHSNYQRKNFTQQKKYCIHAFIR